MNNKNKLTIYEEIKNEAEAELSKFSDAVEKQCTEVSKFTQTNIETLVEMIIEDCQDLCELEQSINILKDSIDANEMLKEKYTYQKDLTKADIINSNFLNMYLLLGGTFFITNLITSNPLEFTKKFLIALAIEAFAFETNLKHFTSDKFKHSLINKISCIDIENEITKYYIHTIEVFCEMQIKELLFEINKLKEITKNSVRATDYEKIEIFLNEIGLSHLLKKEAISAKTRLKTKE